MKHTLLAIAAPLLASLIVLRAADGKPASAERPNIVFVLDDDLGYDLFANESIKWISENKKGPFFLYWAMVVPHANNERTRELRDGAEVPDYAPYSAEDWPNPDRGQAAMNTRLDGYVGRLLAELQRLDWEPKWQAQN